MAKVIKLHIDKGHPLSTKKLGARKAKRKQRVDLEDHGQLNLFDASRQVSFHQKSGYFEEALVLDEKGDPRAESFYQKAIFHRQSVADAYCNLGVIAHDSNQHAQAVDYFSQALKQNPRHVEAHYNLANVYAEQGNITLCRMHYEVSIQIAPDFAPSYYNLSLVLITLKEFDSARNALETYIELSPAHSLEDDDSILQLIQQIKALSS